MSLLTRRRALLSSKGKALLPKEYQQVEWIRFWGSHCIDTGFYANQDTSVQMKVKQGPDTINQSFFCSRTNFFLDAFACFIVSKIIRHDYNISQDTIGLQIQRDEIYDIYAHKNVLTVNEVTHKINYANFNAESSLLLGGSRNAGEISIMNALYGYMYFCKVWDNDTLIRDFIPCYRKQDGMSGMYDLVNGKFYTNCYGSVGFDVGGEV